MQWKYVSSVIMIMMLLGVLVRADTHPGFKKADCPFDVPSGLEVQCGYVTVPERRGELGSPVIHLQVAVVKPLDGNPAPDPVVILNGGPGSSTLAGTQYWTYVFNRILRHRTLILFDPRGVGYSQPSLNCPEAEKQWQQDWTQNQSLQTSSQNYAHALEVCHDRLTAAGIDLSAYTTAANAADVRDLRRALGYSKWNLYGGDYGSRLALAVMREDPGGIRSVILDSAYPPQVDMYSSQAVNLEHSLQLLFDRCAANSKCNAPYPDLQEKFLDLVDTLDSEPEVYRAYNSATGDFHDLSLNGDRLIWAVSQMFYGTGMAYGLPKRISTMKNDLTFSFGDDLYWIVSMNAALSEGAYYSTQCSEETPLSTLTASKLGDNNLSSRLFSALGTGQMTMNCAAWTEGHTTSFSREAMTSDIPTLILAGELDPITPPAWGELAGQTLSRSQFLEFPGFGHGVLGGGPDQGNCTFEIVTAFIDNPKATVDSSCIGFLKMGFLTP